MSSDREQEDEQAGGVIKDKSIPNVYQCFAFLCPPLLTLWANTSHHIATPFHHYGVLPVVPLYRVNVWQHTCSSRYFLLVKQQHQSILPAFCRLASIVTSATKAVI